jgi:hypothetical protein
MYSHFSVTKRVGTMAPTSALNTAAIESHSAAAGTVHSLSELTRPASVPLLVRLKQSPYTTSLSGIRRKRWAPPPGAFNEPDAPPRFATPGPGRYQPHAQHTCLSTKPNITACSFGTEDREKYLGGCLSRTPSGMLIGSPPATSQSPGPVYRPNHALVERASTKVGMSSSASMAALEQRMRGSVPGPAKYSPKPTASSRQRSSSSGCRFGRNDRAKYLGSVDPVSLTPMTKQSPGPIYKPSFAPVTFNPGRTAFGGAGPGSIRRAPATAIESPGPASYASDAQHTVLSTNRRAPASSFPMEPRKTVAVDSMHCYHGKVPIDMRQGDTTGLSPGPCYLPSYAAVRTTPVRAVIGTAKRFSQC